jgi:hypothetical protein
VVAWTFAEVVAEDVDMAVGLLIILLALGLLSVACLIAGAVVLIVWAVRRSSRPTQPPIDFEEPRRSAGPPDTRITR